MQPFDSICSCMRYLESALERRGFMIQEETPKARKSPKERVLAQRLTREQAFDIKAARAQGLTLAIIAHQFGTSKGTVSKICSNKYKPLQA